MAKFEYGVEMVRDGVVGVDWKTSDGVGFGVAWGWNLGLVWVGIRVGVWGGYKRGVAWGGNLDGVARVD